MDRDVRGSLSRVMAVPTTGPRRGESPETRPGLQGESSANRLTETATRAAATPASELLQRMALPSPSRFPGTWASAVDCTVPSRNPFL